MAGSAPFELTIDQQAMKNVASALKSEADGQLLRRELIKRLKMSTRPAISQAQAGIRSAPSHGLTQGQSLRATVATSIKPVVRLSGKQTGVSIRQTGTPGLRGFKMAGRRFNRAQFRHPVYGRAWALQRGKPEWFDRPMQASKPEWEADVQAVIRNLAATIAARARAGH